MVCSLCPDGANAGIVKGISDSEFGIGRYITRQDAAVMFVGFGNNGTSRRIFSL